MIHLVEKEFKINSGLISFKKDKLLSSLLTIILGGIMVYVSTFMFGLLFKKFATYNAELPFAIIYMFILSVITMIYAVFTARRVFFNNEDFNITSYRPIDNFALIFSKVIYLFVATLLFELILLAPHYVVFGQMYNAQPNYYYMILISIIFHAIFDLSVAMILVIGIEAVYRFIKRHLFLQMSVIVLMAVGAMFAYGYVLDLFLKLLNDSNVSYLFNDRNINRIKYLSTILYPDVFISRSLFTLNYRLIFSYFFVTCGIFIFAVILLYIFFEVIINIDGESKWKQAQKPFKKRNQRFAFFKKEIMLLTRETSNLYNFTVLIIIQPILMYLVIVGVNQSFRSGIFSVYASVLPSLITNIDILIVLLFSSLLSLSGANLMKSEHKSIRIIKYLPYKLSNQVYIKMAILGIATLFTNVLSLSILLIFKELNFGTYGFLLLASSLLNVSLIVLSFRSELINFRKPTNENALSALLAFLVPAVLVAINLLGDLLLNMKVVLTYLIDFGLLLVVSLFVLLYLRKKFPIHIENLEVIN